MANRVRLVLSGTLGAGNQERWSCGFNYMNPTQFTGADDAELAEWLSDIATWLAAKPIGYEPRVEMGPNAALNQLDAYLYGALGDLEAKATRYQAGMMVGTGTHRHPFQVARVVTLQSGTPGRSGRGRVYWPALGTLVDTSGQATLSQSDADEYRDLIVGMGDLAEFDPALVPCVYSPTKDQVRALTSVRLGSVLDTQRRRTDKLVQSYTASPVS